MSLHAWEALPKGFGCPPPLLSSAGHEILRRSKLETHIEMGITRTLVNAYMTPICSEYFPFVSSFNPPHSLTREVD